MKTNLLSISTLMLFIVFISCNTFESKNEAEKNDALSGDSNTVKLKLVTSAIPFPVQMNACPDQSHRLFFTDLGGKIWILKNDSLQPKPFLDISDKLEKKDTTPEFKGMFSIAFHPQYASNRKFYVCYNAPTTIKNNICKLVVSEFTTSSNDPDSADVKSERRVFEFEGRGAEQLASQIGFGPDGYLYISIGDHGDSAYKNRAQDLDCFNGKLLRIDVNKMPYAIPADNPFTGIKDAHPEIFAYGFRRLWRFSFDPRTHQLVGGDVGEGKNEELDIITKGANYGWPEREGDSARSIYLQASNTKYASPINTYTHKDGICVIAGSFYYGNGIPFLKNKYVFADFNGILFTLSKNANYKWERQRLNIANKPSDPFLICSCNADESGELYLTGILNKKTKAEGAIYKIVKK